MIIVSWDIGIKNLSYCIMKNENEKYQILQWENISIIDPSKKVKNVSLQTIIVSLLNKLHELDFLEKYPDLKHVLIENQPTKCQKMKNVQLALYTFFLNEGILKSKKDKNLKLQVQFISAKNKLKFYNELQSIDESKYASKSAYTERKKKAILLCQHFIHEYPELNENIKYFETSKKKDDLADCFLYCFYFFRNSV